jgi:hypothetical protein
VGNQPVYQNHHLSYDPEVTVRVRKGVHNICTLIMRHKRGMDRDEKRAIRHALELIPETEREHETN